MAPKRRGARAASSPPGKGRAARERGSNMPSPMVSPRRSGRKRAPSRAWVEATGGEVPKRACRPRGTRGDQASSGECVDAPNGAAGPSGAHSRPSAPRRLRAPEARGRSVTGHSRDRPLRPQSSSEEGAAGPSTPRARGRGSPRNSTVANKLLSAILSTLDEGECSPREAAASHLPSSDGEPSSSSSEPRARGYRRPARAKPRRKGSKKKDRSPESGSEGDTEDVAHRGEHATPCGRRSRRRRPPVKRGARHTRQHTSHDSSDSCTAEQVWDKSPGKRAGKSRRAKRVSSSESSLDFSSSTSTSGEHDSDNPFPPGLPDTPLGMHMSQALKKKIWKGAYVDMFALLLPEKSKKERAKEAKRGGQEAKEPRMDMGILSWSYAFLAYHSVVVEKDVHRTHELIPYMNLILKAYHEFGGSAWRQYDESFRRYAAHHRDWPWDRKHPDLWLQATQQTAVPAEGRTPTGHLLLSRAKEASLPRPGFGPGNVTPGQRAGTSQTFRPPAYCYEYGAKGTCARVQCRFRHACSNCNGRHPASNCYRAKGGAAKEAGASSKQQASGTQTKGTNAH